MDHMSFKDFCSRAVHLQSWIRTQRGETLYLLKKISLIINFLFSFFFFEKVSLSNLIAYVKYIKSFGIFVVKYYWNMSLLVYLCTLPYCINFILLIVNYLNFAASNNTHLSSHSTIDQKTWWAQLGSLLSWNQGVGQTGLLLGGPGEESTFKSI